MDEADRANRQGDHTTETLFRAIRLIVHDELRPLIDAISDVRDLLRPAWAPAGSPSKEEVFE